MSDRVTGLIVAIVALAFFASATQLEAPFFADPLGSKFFPMLVAAVAFVSAAFLVFKPDPEPRWPALAVLAKVAGALGVLIAYALALKPLGFLLPTAIAAAAISFQINGDVKKSAVTGALLALALLLVFKYALGLSLFALPRWLAG